MPRTANPEAKRGPGRPRKGAEPRVPRTLHWAPDILALIEAHRLSGESMSDVVNRVVRQALAPP